jgi:hypothetical protein
MWELKTRAVLIGLLFLLQGCGARYHLNRAIAKDPQILDSVVLKVDTLIITQKEEVRDTLILQKIDTITVLVILSGSPKRSEYLNLSIRKRTLIGSIYTS